MAQLRSIDRQPTAGSFVLGRKLDSIPFRLYHMLVIGVLALVGFIEGYDLVITGSLLVLAKEPLHLTGSDIRWLAVGSTFMLCLGGFASSAVSDHWSRKRVVLIGVVSRNRRVSIKIWITLGPWLASACAASRHDAARAKFSLKQRSALGRCAGQRRPGDATIAKRLAYLASGLQFDRLAI